MYVSNKDFGYLPFLYFAGKKKGLTKISKYVW